MECSSVWAVVSGSYSDYEVHCIFEAEDDATAFATLFNAQKSAFYDEARVEGFCFYARGGQPKRVALHTVELRGDEEVSSPSQLVWEFEVSEESWCWDGRNARGTATSHERALKIAQDAAAAERARRAGVA